MTRPIFEPTTKRDISRQGYGNRQLLRRPAPPAVEAVEEFANWSQTELTSGSVAAGSSLLANAGADTYNESHDSVVIASTRVADSKKGIRILVPGLWIFSAQCGLTTNIVNPIRIQFVALDDVASPGVITPLRGVDFIRPGATNSAGQRFINVTWQTIVIDDEPDWDAPMTGAHDFPLRVGLQLNHSEAGNITVIAQLQVGLIRLLNNPT
jgi:hypothetical protein